MAFKISKNTKIQKIRDIYSGEYTWRQREKRLSD